MEEKHRITLDVRLRDFFIKEVREEFGQDFTLIEDRIDRLLNLKSLKETRESVRAELAYLKQKQNMSALTTKVSDNL